MRNFRPCNVLNTFSKIYEQVIKEQIVLGTNNFLSPKTSAYKILYGTQHASTSLVEDCRENVLVDAILTDISGAFDCIPHDLLIAKLAAYGFDFDTLTLIFACLKNRKQSVRIKSRFSRFENIISRVPQESISGRILFDLSINYCFTLSRSFNIYFCR